MFDVVPKGAGVYQIRVLEKCLNVYKGLDADNTAVNQYTCNDTALNNLWRFVPVTGKTTVRIVSAKSGKCLNIKGGSTADDVPLIIYTCGTKPDTGRNDQFYFGPTTSPDAVPVATMPLNTPVVAAQGGAGSAAVGPLVYGFTDNVGRLYRAYQSDPDTFSTIQWSVLPGNDQFAGPPAVAVQADGKVQVAARNALEGDLWLSTQSAAGQSTFGGWQDVGGAGTGQPATGKLPDGKIVGFAPANGGVWHLPQNGTHVPYGAWRFLGGDLRTPSVTGAVTVVTTQTGLRLFALNAAGVPHTAVYTNGALSDWVSLGGSGMVGKPAAVIVPGYRARVVVRTADGTIVTKAEAADGSFPAEWTPVGDFVADGDPAVVMDPLSGKISIVARAADGLVHHVSETEQGTGVFGSWSVAVERPVATDPVIVSFTRTNGPAWGYTVRDANFQPYLVTKEGIAPAMAARSAAADAAESSFVSHQLPKPPVG